MLSIEQQENIRKRIISTALSFLESDCTIAELSKTTNQPASTIQRDLNSPIVEQFLGLKSKLLIEKKLLTHKQLGISNGGKHYSENNVPIKDEQGKFVGSKPRER